MTADGDKPASLFGTRKGRISVESNLEPEMKVVAGVGQILRPPPSLF